MKRMGVGVVFVDGGGRILLVKPIYKDHWSIPGGVVDKNESPKGAARREVEEELGLKVKVERLLAVSYNRNEEMEDESLQWFFAGGILSQDRIREIKLEEKEISEYKFVKTSDEAGAMGEGMKERLEFYRKILEASGAMYLENNREV